MNKLDYINVIVRDAAVSNGSVIDLENFNLQFCCDLRNSRTKRDIVAYVYPKNNPRLVIPSYESDPYIFWTALNFYQPRSMLVKLGQIFVHFFLRVFHTSPFVLRVYTNQKFTLNSAFYIPNDYMDRKVISFHDKQGLLCITKFASTCAAYVKLKNELIFLKSPPQKLRRFIPKIVDVKTDNGHEQLVFTQTFEINNSSPSDELVYEFIRAVSNPVKRIQLDRLRAELEHADDFIISNFLNENKSKPVWISRVHGDLAPWNIVCSNDQLKVFDWEDTRNDGIYLDDMFRYFSAISRARRVMPTQKFALFLICKAEKFLDDASFVDVNVQLIAWALAHYKDDVYYREMLRVAVKVALSKDKI